jgi:gamma-glutamyl-gamma-aminobutyrate hydrolase PuuD
VGVTYSIPRRLAAYADAVKLAGVEPVPIAPGQPVSIAGLDGLVITGGCDIDSARYGQAPLDVNDAPDKDRDELEAVLLSQAIEADLPVLAICRGLQLLNVVCRGTLKQDIPGHKAKGIADAHPVAIRSGSKLGAILSQTAITVNSRHHQAVDCVGEGLVVSAEAPDGTVEALERPDKRFVLAVQWHPEDRVLTHPSDRKLFDAFAAAVLS